MKKKLFLKNILPLLPLLALYIVVVAVFSSDKIVGDESRYIEYATHLTQGYFVDADNPNLRNGPGYPLVLAPFLAFDAGPFTLRLLNAFIIFIGVVYFKKTVELFTKNKYAIVLAYLIGLYPPLIQRMPFVFTEPLSFMLLCGAIFHLCKLYQIEKIDWKQQITASFYLGFLVLVKVIFFQVIAVSLVLLGGIYLFRRHLPIKKASFVILGSFLFISPYLIFAYSITGKPFYLGTQGGEILYHRSTPYEKEWGNWFSRNSVLYGEKDRGDQAKTYQDLSTLSKNHRDFYLKTEPLTFIERDSAFKAQAIRNIKAHPMKYLKNTTSNVGRLLFHFPFSYRTQGMSAYGYMIPNMFIVVLWIISLYPFLLARKKVPFEIKAVMTFALIYAGGMFLLQGKGRHFIFVVPAMVLFCTFIYTNILKITLAKHKK